jgi:excisionase family DNA binding protein
MARFLTLDDVADELAISKSQVYALVRGGDLPAMKVGGRGQWRIERSRLEQWIEQTHADTVRFVEQHPPSDDADGEEPV